MRTFNEDYLCDEYVFCIAYNKEKKWAMTRGCVCTSVEFGNCWKSCKIRTIIIIIAHAHKYEIKYFESFEHKRFVGRLFQPYVECFIIYFVHMCVSV